MRIAAIKPPVSKEILLTEIIWIRHKNGLLTEQNPAGNAKGATLKWYILDYFRYFQASSKIPLASLVTVKLRTLMEHITLVCLNCLHLRRSAIWICNDSHHVKIAIVPGRGKRKWNCWEQRIPFPQVCFLIPVMSIPQWTSPCTYQKLRVSDSTSGHQSYCVFHRNPQRHQTLPRKVMSSHEQFWRHKAFWQGFLPLRKCTRSCKSHRLPWHCLDLKSTWIPKGIWILGLSVPIKVRLLFHLFLQLGTLCYSYCKTLRTTASGFLKTSCAFPWRYPEGPIKAAIRKSNTQDILKVSSIKNSKVWKALIRIIKHLFYWTLTTIPPVWAKKTTCGTEPRVQRTFKPEASWSEALQKTGSGMGILAPIFCISSLLKHHLQIFQGF